MSQTLGTQSPRGDTAQMVLIAGTARLREAGIEDPARDGRILMAYALGLTPERLSLHLRDPITDTAKERFHQALTARLNRQPVAQIIGVRHFYGHEFRVTRDTLDPRPDTEVLVDEALSAPFHKILDMGTGTGCILLSCLKGMPMAQGVGLDISPAALHVAQENARNLGLEGRAKFRLSDWFSAVSDRYDLIVSNPPYIAADEMHGLSPEVQNWEPHLALTPGGDGLEPYRVISRGARSRLIGGGRILFEIGPTQGAAVSQMLCAQGFEDIRVLPDLDGRDRVVRASAPLADPEDCAGG